MADSERSPAKRVDEDPECQFAAVVEAHWAAVFRLLQWMSGNVHDAEELTQETFLRAFQHLDAARPDTQLRPWLLRIASNAFLDVKRKEKKAKPCPWPDDVADDRVSPPERQIEIAEQAQLARVALALLSETTRAVFQLRVEESMSYAEISTMLKISAEAARWHMHNARTKLLQHLSAQEE